MKLTTVEADSGGTPVDDLDAVSRASHGGSAFSGLPTFVYLTVAYLFSVGMLVLGFLDWLGC